MNFKLFALEEYKYDSISITMEDRNYTIKDIAKLAGVSAGTVDRVLHNRGEVSEVSRQKVQKVLDEIDYRPNMFAIGLAAKKKYTVCCFIPKFTGNDYWSSVAAGIDRAAQEFKAFNVKVDYLTYDHNSLLSYQETGKQLIAKAPDAVLLAPNFQDETYLITKELNEQNIPFALVDVNVEGVGALKYIGQDSFQSGYIAAKILMREYTGKEELVLFLNKAKESPSEIQMQRRLNGFLKFLNDNYGALKLHEVILDRSNEQENKQVLSGFFAQHPQVTMGVMFNSRVYEVANYLKQNNKRMNGLIGYDLLPQNVLLMQEGYVTYLLGQRPGLQGYCAVKALVDKVVFKQDVEPLKYMPIDVLMKDNIDYYFEFV